MSNLVGVMGWEEVNDPVLMSALLLLVLALGWFVRAQALRVGAMQAHILALEGEVRASATWAKDAAEIDGNKKWKASMAALCKHTANRVEQTSARLDKSVRTTEALGKQVAELQRETKAQAAARPALATVAAAVAVVEADVRSAREAFTALEECAQANTAAVQDVQQVVTSCSSELGTLQTAHADVQSALEEVKARQEQQEQDSNSRAQMQMGQSQGADIMEYDGVSHSDSDGSGSSTPVMDYSQSIDASDDILNSQPDTSMYYSSMMRKRTLPSVTANDKNNTPLSPEERPAKTKNKNVSFTPDQEIALVSVYEQVREIEEDEVHNPTSEDADDAPPEDADAYEEDTFEGEPVASAPTRQNLSGMFSKATDSLNHGLTGDELKAVREGKSSSSSSSSSSRGKQSQPDMMNAIIQSMATTTAPKNNAASAPPPSSSSSSSPSSSSSDPSSASAVCDPGGDTASASTPSSSSSSSPGDTPGASSAASDKLKRLEAFLNSKKMNGKMSVRDRMKGQRRLVTRGGWRGGGGTKDANSTI
jgi:hypothetical protein